MLTRHEVVAAVLRAPGRDGRADSPSTRCTALFRLAVIAQQIYYRYFHRQTRNPAFKNFWLFVHYLEWRCWRLIRAAR